MTDKLLLTFNTGSSTVKIGIFRLDGRRPERIGKAVVDFAARPLALHLTEGPVQFELPLKGEAGDDLAELMDEVLRKLGTHFDLDAVTAAGHRIVHGGDIFDGPIELTAETSRR